MAPGLEQRVEAERLRAELDERRYIRRLIDAGRRGEKRGRPGREYRERASRANILSVSPSVTDAGPGF